MIAAIRGTQDILPGRSSNAGSSSSDGAAACSSGTATPRSARRSSSARSCSPRAPARRPTSSRRRCTRSPTRAASGSRSGPRRRPAWCARYVEHALEQAMAVPKIYTHRPDVPVRAAAEGALPAVPPARRRGVRRQGPVGRRRGDRPRVDARSASWASPDVELVDQLGRLPGLPAARSRRRCVAALGEDVPKLCGDCQRRAVTNPLRIFDCKVPADQPIIDRAAAHRSTTCATSAAAHFDGGAGAPRRCSGFRTRSRTGWCAASTTTRARRSRCWPGSIGAQNALLGGGRYDGLVKHLGGPDRVGHRLRRGHRAARARAARDAGAAASSGPTCSSRRSASRPATRRWRCCATCGGPG